VSPCHGYALNPIGQQYAPINLDRPNLRDTCPCEDLTTKALIISYKYYAKYWSGISLFIHIFASISLKRHWLKC